MTLQTKLIDFFEQIAILSDTRDKLAGLSNGRIDPGAWALAEDDEQWAILRVLRGEAHGGDDLGPYQVGAALAELCLADDQWTIARLDALILLLEHTWGTEGFIDILRGALQDTARKPAALNFFQALVTESNTHPEVGFLGRDNEHAAALRQMWDETGEIQTLLTPYSHWDQEPYHYGLWQIVAALLLDAPGEITCLLDDVQYPWVLSDVLNHLPCERAAEALLALLERGRSSYESHNDAGAKWNQSILAPLALNYMLQLAAHDWDALGAVDFPASIRLFLSRGIKVLLNRPDAVPLAFQFGVALVPQLDDLTCPDTPSRSAQLADVCGQLLEQELDKQTLGELFYQLGAVLTDPGLSDNDFRDFTETGRLRQADWPYRLDALVTLAAWLPDSDITSERAQLILTRYENQLAAGLGVFPSRTKGLALPSVGHQALARIYSRMDQPMLAWEQSGTVLNGLSYRLPRNPFDHQSHDLRSVETFHLWVGIALDDLLNQQGGERNPDFLSAGVERVKNRLIVLDDSMGASEIYRLLAMHLTTRLFLHQTTKNDGAAASSIACVILSRMASVPVTALGILDMLISNGLGLLDIRADSDCLAFVHALRMASEWRVLLSGGNDLLISRALQDFLQVKG